MLHEFGFTSKLQLLRILGQREWLPSTSDLVYFVLYIRSQIWPLVIARLHRRQHAISSQRLVPCCCQTSVSSANALWCASHVVPVLQELHKRGRTWSSRATSTPSSGPCQLTACSTSSWATVETGRARARDVRGFESWCERCSHDQWPGGALRQLAAQQHISVSRLSLVVAFRILSAAVEGFLPQDLRHRCAVPAGLRRMEGYRMRFVGASAGANGRQALTQGVTGRAR